MLISKLSNKEIGKIVSFNSRNPDDWRHNSWGILTGVTDDGLGLYTLSLGGIVFNELRSGTDVKIHESSDK